MLKTLVACGALGAIALLSAAFADTTSADKVTGAQAFVPAKTSDRTHDNPSPNRTSGASITGAAGTEVARTPYGTSDRTPSNHYHPATN
jgi:hypothetical protein